MKRITRILRFLLTRLVDKRRVDHSLENRNGWTEKEYNEREEGWSDILEKPWSCRPTRAEERTGVFLSFLFERCNTLHRELNLPPRSIEIWKRDCIHVCQSCAFACDPRIRGQLKLAGVRGGAYRVENGNWCRLIGRKILNRAASRPIWLIHRVQTHRSDHYVQLHVSRGRCQFGCGRNKTKRSRFRRPASYWIDTKSN